MTTGGHCTASLFVKYLRLLIRCFLLVKYDTMKLLFFLILWMDITFRVICLRSLDLWNKLFLLA